MAARIELVLVLIYATFAHARTLDKAPSAPFLSVTWSRPNGVDNTSDCEIREFLLEVIGRRQRDNLRTPTDTQSTQRVRDELIVPKYYSAQR